METEDIEARVADLERASELSEPRAIRFHPDSKRCVPDLFSHLPGTAHAEDGTELEALVIPSRALHTRSTGCGRARSPVSGAQPGTLIMRLTAGPGRFPVPSFCGDYGRPFSQT